MEFGWLNRLTSNTDGARMDWLRVIELATTSEAAETAARILEKIDP
ncbi:MAG: hypothetical protein ACKVK8_00575 [Rhodospirillales bacterium]|jgi:hypothetical protein